MLNDVSERRNKMSEKMEEEARETRNERYEKPKLERKGRIRDITAGGTAS